MNAAQIHERAAAGRSTARRPQAARPGCKARLPPNPHWTSAIQKQARGIVNPGRRIQAARREASRIRATRKLQPRMRVDDAADGGEAANAPHSTRKVRQQSANADQRSWATGTAPREIREQDKRREHAVSAWVPALSPAWRETLRESSGARRFRAWLFSSCSLVRPERRSRSPITRAMPPSESAGVEVGPKRVG